MMIDTTASADAFQAEFTVGQVRSRTSGLQRALDLLVAIPLLIVLAPILAAVALAVWLNDGGPVLFGHTRIGRDGRTFKCLKFRSMVLNSADVLREVLAADPAARAEWEKDHKLRNDPRITAVGRVIRASSLDELPQLLNVVRGDMSLVGPRPIVAAEISRYGVRFHDYCGCRPGITGLWQVSGRNDVSYRRRVAIDTLYARTRSVQLDLYILIKTVPAVLLRRGSY